MQNSCSKTRFKLGAFLLAAAFETQSALGQPTHNQGRGLHDATPAREVDQSGKTDEFLWGHPFNEFALGINFESEAIPAGQPIVAHLRLVSYAPSNRLVSVSAIAAESFTFSILDESGKEVPLLSAKEPTLGPGIISSDGLGLESFGPDQPQDYRLRLDTKYELSRPRTYFVTARRILPKGPEAYTDFNIPLSPGVLDPSGTNNLSLTIQLPWGGADAFAPIQSGTAMIRIVGPQAGPTPSNVVSSAANPVIRKPNNGATASLPLPHTAIPASQSPQASPSVHEVDNADALLGMPLPVSSERAISIGWVTGTAACFAALLCGVLLLFRRRKVIPAVASPPVPPAGPPGSWR